MINKNNILYYSIIILILCSILFSEPFLKYPYDMFYNLILLDTFYQVMGELDTILPNRIWVDGVMGIGNIVDSSIVPDNPYIWHYLWAKIFYIMNISPLDIFLRAKIIHMTQIYISLFSIYYFSMVILRNLFTKIKPMDLKWLSFWSLIIWLTIFSTFSIVSHQVWIMWYSVNYQITLPLFWYITALTLVLFLEKTSLIKKIFFTLQILILSKFILQAHSMEFMYYLMYLSLFILVFLDKVYFNFKKYFYVLLPIIITIGYFLTKFTSDRSRLFDYLSLEKLPILYTQIMKEGSLLVVHHYNRANSSINELMYLIALSSIFFMIYLLITKYQNKTIGIQPRILIFIGLSSLFILIPLYQFSGGLFSIITKMVVVNRLYYSSSLFILLPIFIYSIMTSYHTKFRYINLTLFISLLSVSIFSKHSNIVTHNYYKNITSIKNSFIENKVGFNLSKQQIKTIGTLIQNYEEKNYTDRTIQYYVRADIAFILKYFYKKNVYWEGRRANPDYLSIYHKNKENTDYLHILFKIPKDFPSYQPYL
ncbi:MAG: hypothetical protein Q9M36_10640 [Sulfurovum sp.]|nr:hypothetical protein [Sulfurovum sp.]